MSKQYWIKKDQNLDFSLSNWSSNLYVSTRPMDDEDEIKWIHVIEKSAFDKAIEALKEITELEQVWQTRSDRRDVSPDDLKEIARNALELLGIKN